MLWCWVMAVMCLSLISGHACAGDAEVLPKGNFAFNVDYKHYFNWDKRFDKDGNGQNAASDFNNVLDSSIFPDLAAFDGFVQGTPNIGISIVSFKYKYERIDMALAYGFTDKLSFGIKIPYIWYKNEVDARLDTTDANVGKNPIFDPEIPPGLENPPLIPTAIGGEKLTTEDVQNLLGDGLFTNGGLAIPGFGFKPVQTWREEGLGDIEAGFKYQYHKSEMWRLAVLGGAVFPTGRVDDPDNLVDQPLGGGGYALLFRSYNDFRGIRNVVLNGSVFYTLTLSQDRDRRIVADPHQPLTRVKEKVGIDSGDVLEVETSARYSFDDVPSLAGTSVELLYHYAHTFKSDVTGPDGQRIPSLEAETDGDEHMYIARLTYSTIPLFLKKEFPVPMDVSSRTGTSLLGTTTLSRRSTCKQE